MKEGEAAPPWKAASPAQLAAGGRGWVLDRPSVSSGVPASSKGPLLVVGGMREESSRGLGLPKGSSLEWPWRSCWPKGPRSGGCADGGRRGARIFLEWGGGGREEEARTRQTWAGVSFFILHLTWGPGRRNRTFGEKKCNSPCFPMASSVSELFGVGKPSGLKRWSMNLTPDRREGKAPRPQGQQLTVVVQQVYSWDQFSLSKNNL